MEGECVENSSTESGASPILICGTRGQWQVININVCVILDMSWSQDMCSGKARGYIFLKSKNER